MEVDEYKGNNEEEFSDEDQDDNDSKVGELECDLSAYVLFHEGNTGAPCLSFDIIKDNLGDDRNCETPVTCYFVAGTQADQEHVNSIVLMKMSNLHKIDQDVESDDESDGDEDDEPVISSILVNHNGCVNRIRATQFQDRNLAASWSESGHVSIWNLNPLLEALENQDTMNNFKNDSPPTPIFTFNGHRDEGFALDWAPSMPGTLATGDCCRNIHIWKPNESGTWSVGSKPYNSHRASVEDIQWSPNEPHVFASCSVDKSIKIWDSRAKPNKACMLTCENAHEKDVNVIHWNRNEPFLASGGDDSKVLIWDLRKFETKSPLAYLQYHDEPVCTIEWHNSDSSVLASGSEDNRIIQWDLAVEKDESDKTEETDTPQQLLFIHEGQKEVKEIHWHPQISGLMISTAVSGFNVFKTISC